MLREKSKKKMSTPKSRLNENHTEYYVINFSFYTLTYYFYCESQPVFWELHSYCTWIDYYFSEQWIIT